MTPVLAVQVRNIKSAVDWVKPGLTQKLDRFYDSDKIGLFPGVLCFPAPQRHLL